MDRTDLARELPEDAVDLDRMLTDVSIYCSTETAGRRRRRRGGIGGCGRALTAADFLGARGEGSACILSARIPATAEIRQNGTFRPSRVV
ncbi:hypothetical protein AB0O28_27300 [Microbispora sp. NPDC088329]|uniref:hypothetical protein n=1 Tax=Microbispora sp. NPDC088329 TaxID=3154869 RepID=UPI0034169F30